MLVVLGEVYWRNVKISFPIIYKNGIGTFQYFHLFVREREREERVEGEQLTWQVSK